MSLEDTVNDGRKCGAPDALCYLFSILFFAPLLSEQTLMNVNEWEVTSKRRKTYWLLLLAQ